MKLTTVGAPTPQVSETTVTRADAPKVLEYNWGGFDMRWELEAAGRRHAPDAVANIDRRFISMGAAGLAHLLRCAGSAARRSPHRPHRRSRRDEVRRLAAAERRVREAVRHGRSEVGVPVNWNSWIRQIHRWVSIAFTVTVIANFVALAQGGGMPPPWVTYSPLLPLALLLFTGLYMFVLPYAARWRSGRRA